jgi:octaprenyl-diphosphate synthase
MSRRVLDNKGAMILATDTKRTAQITPISSLPDDSGKEALTLNLESDLESVENCLRARLSSCTHYPRELAERLIAAGGKRLRPLLLLAVYHSLKNDIPTSQINNSLSKGITSPEDLHQLGAVAELVHMATLFHDDVIDHSDERRGMASAHTLYGNKIAILVGDFVYAEAFARLMERAFLHPSKTLAKTIQQLVEGEILQHEIVQNRNFDRKKLLQIAELKTASLFAWCSEIGAWAAGHTSLLEEASSFGKHLGLAFQIIDDTIDTLAVGEDLSPEFCKEFLASAPSFPVLLLCENSDEAYKTWKKIPELEEVEQKKTIQNLISQCQSPELLQRCKDKITESLDLAEAMMEKLGSSLTLQGLILQLKMRAELALEGEKLS